MALFNLKSQHYRNDNPDLPTLEPWMLMTQPPSSRFVFDRNPYFHRVDSDGRQLPYIDSGRADRRQPATDSGEGGRRATRTCRRAVSASRTTRSSSRARSAAAFTSACGGRRAVPSWRSTPTSTSTIPAGARCCATSASAARCRSPSTATRSTRSSITAWPSRATTRCCRKARCSGPSTPTRGRSFDPAEANRLLDEIGLGQRGSDGIRRMPDGRPLEIVVETAGEDPTQMAILQLMTDTGGRSACRCSPRPSSARCSATASSPGQTLMSVWYGLENALADAVDAAERAGADQPAAAGWPKWGQYCETGGRAGEPPRRRHRGANC